VLAKAGAGTSIVVELAWNGGPAEPGGSRGGESLP
jgi:hypothetical protein